MEKVFSTFAQGTDQYLHMIFSNGKDHSRYGLQTLFSKGGDKVVSAIWTDLEPLAKAERTLDNLISKNFESPTLIQDNYLAIMNHDDVNKGLGSNAFFNKDGAPTRFAAQVYGNGLKDAGG
eukprot:1099061_1